MTAQTQNPIEARLRTPEGQPFTGQAIDYYLARQLCDWLGCNEDWLFHSLAATSLALQQGHTCLYLPAVAGQSEWRSEESTGYSFPELSDWLHQLEQLPIGPEDQAPVVLDNQRLYLRRYWQFETELAIRLRQRMQQQHQPDLKTAKSALATLFPKLAQGSDAADTDWQALAAANALFNGFSIIAGGPGTGKTYTVTRLLALLAQTSPEPLTIRMAAPTGKAAQRLAESIRAAKADLQGRLDMITLDSIPDEATTLHRLLGVIPNRLDFRHNERNPLHCDVLLVDEVSMVDLPMMTRLFRALPEHCRVILLGDADQLPSVAAGSILADLAERPHPGYSQKRAKALKQLGFKLSQEHIAQSKHPPCDYLNYLYHSRRFDGAGGIGILARQVINGEAEASLATLRGDYPDLAWIPTDQAHSQITRWVNQWYRPIAQAESLEAAFDALFQFRLLCPTRVGPMGIEALNDRILKTLNPTRQPFFKGQPVMITENHYGVGLYNGDIGLLWPDDKGHLLAWFPSGEGYRPLAPGRLPRFETVYAMTIHKTQGSEFERVALVLPDEPMAMLSRELIYTGLTRAKKELFVSGREVVWLDSIQRQVERYSGLHLNTDTNPSA